MPVMYLDETAQMSNKLTPLNRTVSELDLKITYEPMAFARWQMLLILENSFKQQKEMGLGEQDIDDARSMLSGSNPILLLVTFIVTALHIVFEFLAFQSDIHFWKRQDNANGISVRGMAVDLVSQIVILLYLTEQHASVLIVVPSVFSILIQMWKIFKATGTSLILGPYYMPTIASPPSSASDSKISTLTSDIDRIAMGHMYFIGAPVLLGYSLYSLIYLSHARVYNWLLGSLVGVVYTFGFIMMTPQLFINYKLKSVAHLPWKTLIYRALNTFIDDLFAFMIEMPTMHRMSCFRDDIVFFVYMYQRYIYPVDKARVFDDAEGDDEGVATKDIVVDNKNKTE